MKNTRYNRVFGLISAMFLLGCQGNRTLSIPFARDTIIVDGRLDEVYYRAHKPLSAFVSAGDHAHKPPLTRAWLFWCEENLTIAFECGDKTLASASPTTNERNVDGQDRIEFFIWNGKPSSPYFCVEISPDGAVHDYKARFYRRFDDRWMPDGEWSYSALKTRTGYNVEVVLSRKALERMGCPLAKGHTFQLGLFRADFDKFNGNPTWITWVDYGGEPDFHISESFGHAELTKPRSPR